MKPKCPQCGSSKVIEHKNYIKFITCNNCGYNELEEDTNLGQRTSQREKGRFSPYKTGGKGRVRK